jgi:adenosine kinase
MSLQGAFFGIGNPLLDISADVDQAFLDKYGVSMNNAILAEEKHMPIYADLQENCKVQYIAGGATQNTVRVCQWMSQTEGATSYVGCVGKDKVGEQLKSCASADGVAVHYLEDDKEPTGTCAVLVLNKERSLVTSLAAANAYKKDHFDSAHIQAVVEKAQYFYSAGFFLTVSPPTLMAIGEHCAKTNKIMSMNISAPFIAQFFTDPLLAAIPFCDYLFGNESEAEALGEKLGYEDKSVKNVALQISKMDKTNSKRSRVVVITQGASSTVVAQDGKVREYAVPKLEAEKIVDVNGAGDSFVGGFFASLMKGKSEEECVQAGHYAASVILQVSGCVLSGKPDAKFL